MHVFVYIFSLLAAIDAARLRAGNAHHGRHGGRGGDNADGGFDQNGRYLISGASQARVTGSLDEVITLLTTMIREFDTQATEDKENWEKYQKWSDESEAEKNTFINDQNALIMAAQAKENANKQNVQKLVEDLGKLSQDIATTEGSLRELQKMRAEERASFEAALADVSKTITAVDKATEILEGHYSADKATLAEIRTRVQMALSTSGLHISTTAEKSVENLASLLQSTVERRAPEYLNVDGAAAYGKYDSQAGGHGVMGMLSDLRAQLETQRQEMVQKENESQRQFEETKAAKDADLAAARKQVAEKTETQAKCEAIIEQSIATANQASKDIDDGNAFLTQLLADRGAFTKQFGERTAMRKQEQAATQAALDALQSVSLGAKAGTGAAANFIQVSQTTSRNSMDANAAKKVIHVMTKLIELGKELHSTALVRVATQLKQKVDSRSTHQQKVDSKNTHQQKGYDQSDFEPVMKLLSDLIARLEEEANAEASQHEWCETEKSQGLAAQQERERNIHALKGTIESLTTMIAQLKTEVEFMESEIVRVNAETKDAKAIRAQEHAVFVQAKKDHEEVINALQAAIKAMTGQYGFLQSFVQVKSNTTRQSPFGAYASGAGSAGSAMEMLEDLLGRYASALTGLINDEESAQKMHDELVARNEQFLMDTTASKNAKVAERRRSINDLAADKEDMKTNLLELHDVSKYLQDLRPSCDDIRSTFEERKRRREAEIDALREALSVLSDPSMMA